MNTQEQSFDINIVLMSLFSSLESIRNEKNIELIYEMDATIPRELRGDFAVLLRLLHKILTFVCEHANQKEIILHLSAPEDFLYEEPISFKINQTNISKEKIREYLAANINKDLEKLNGKIIYDSAEEFLIEIPFKLHELGYRRHYRLPYASMLHKKILVLCDSERLGRSIAKMLEYFLYEVDVGLEAYKAQGSNAALYDILIIEEGLVTDALNKIVIGVQEKKPFKYVVLKDSHIHTSQVAPCVSTHLIKPVTQESIFELIVSLYKDEKDTAEITIGERDFTVDIEKYLQAAQEEPVVVQTIEPQAHPLPVAPPSIKTHKEEVLPILDTEMGRQNAQKMGLNYKNELKLFLEIFDRSDIYFRQIVNEKAVHKIKQFCIDLEKQSKIIGARSMLKFADTVSLIFVYNKLDMLVIYPGKFHIELDKLIKEIQKEIQ